MKYLKVVLLIGIIFLATTVSAAIEPSLITKNLSLGLKNDAQVKILQKLLIEKGFLNSEVTGTFGAKTFAAVKYFQKKNNISQTGTVGPKTMAVVNGLLSKSVQQNSVTNGIQTPQPTVAISSTSTQPSTQNIPTTIGVVNTPNSQNFSQDGSPIPTASTNSLPVILGITFFQSTNPASVQGSYTSVSNSSDVWIEYWPQNGGSTQVSEKIHNTTSGTIQYSLPLINLQPVPYFLKIFVSDGQGTVSSNSHQFSGEYIRNFWQTIAPTSFTPGTPTDVVGILQDADRYYHINYTFRGFCNFLNAEVGSVITAGNLARGASYSEQHSCSEGVTTWRITYYTINNNFNCIDERGAVAGSSINSTAMYSCPREE